MNLSNIAAGNTRSNCYRSGYTADADIQSAALIYQRWKQRYDQLSSGRFEGSVEELELPPFTVLKECSNRIVHQAGSAPAGVFAVGAVTRLSGDAYFRGDILRRQCLAMVDPLREFELRTAEDFEIVGAAFSPEILCAYVNDPGIDFRELESDLYRAGRTIDNPQTEHLQSFLVRLLETAREDSALMLRPENVRSIAEEFYELLSACLSPQNHASAPSVCENRDRLVRRVRVYLDSSHDSAVTISDVCREVGVTRRTLQNATQEVLGVSPQHYLKAVRLNGLRRELKQRDPARESIGDVASRWGFWHLSQLAQDYRRLFGELPSQTSAHLH
ncbi:MAG: transcriptional regulator AraC family [Rhodocyclaceae bacterium]|nr:MAG: transcriptional regulator AraC family [Rhodocyclaceae bacterium]